jgi:transposase
LIVADSALYTAKTLQDLGDFPWITRVPETIGGTGSPYKLMQVVIFIDF